MQTALAAQHAHFVQLLQRQTQRSEQELNELRTALKESVASKAALQARVDMALPPLTLAATGGDDVDPQDPEALAAESTRLQQHISRLQHDLAALDEEL